MQLRTREQTSLFLTLICLLVMCLVSCSSASSSDNLNSEPYTPSMCQMVGDTVPCTCDDGRQGQKTCLPSLDYSSCFCQTSGDSEQGGTVVAPMAGAGGTVGGGAGGLVGGFGGSQAATGGIGGSGGSQAGTGVTSGSGGDQAGTGGMDQGGSGGDPFIPPEECSNMPPLPITEFTKLDHVPGAEDFTFDKLGNLVAVSMSNELFRCPYSGTPEIIMPNVSTGSAGGMSIYVRGIRYLDQSTLVYADGGTNALVRLNLNDFSKDIILSGMSVPNGVAVGMNGMVYVTEMGGFLHQIDPGTKSDTPVYNNVTNVSLDGIAFSADYSRLFFNTEVGYVSYIPFNPDGTTEEYVLLAEGIGGGGRGMLDGMAADECGNAYTVQMSGTIWRISPDGVVEEVVTVSDLGGSTGGSGRPGGSGGNINAVNFGSGIGGWKEDALYIMSMGGGVYEVVLGVKGAPQPHLL